jgi:hypothetical protein
MGVLQALRPNNYTKRLIVHRAFSSAGSGMHTGFDILESSSALRSHWLRRFVAGFVDIAIIFVPIYFALTLGNVTNTTIVAGLSAGVGWFLYAGFMEGRYGRTIGRRWCARRWCPWASGGPTSNVHPVDTEAVLVHLLPFDVFVGLP